MGRGQNNLRNRSKLRTRFWKPLLILVESVQSATASAVSFNIQDIGAYGSPASNKFSVYFDGVLQSSPTVVFDESTRVLSVSFGAVAGPGVFVEVRSAQYESGIRNQSGGYLAPIYWTQTIPVV